MKEAFRYSSIKGTKVKINARRITSAWEARKLGPFFQANKQLYWVSPAKRNGYAVNPYFRNYPKGSRRRSLASLLNECARPGGESKVHELARETTKELMRERLNSKRKIEWHFIDRRVSAFPLGGDILSEVEKVDTEYWVVTPFGQMFRVDLALLGRKINGVRPLLGIIEFEGSHGFNHLRCMMLKSLGCPLIAVNIKGLQKEDISRAWSYRMLTQTSLTAPEGRRGNYIYLHEMLYPVYTNIPHHIRKDHKHEFIVFAGDGIFEELIEKLRELKYAFRLGDGQVLIQEARNGLGEAGRIVGRRWREYNRRRYIRVALDVPLERKGGIYLFHLAMANLLNAQYDTLVGYKYRREATGGDRRLWHRGDGSGGRLRIIQKHMSEPLRLILNELSSSKTAR
jgi:hypothetical protein